MQSYRSLLAWQRAHHLCVMLFRTTDAAFHPRSKPLFDQMRRSAVSVPANIVEGYALRTQPQFRRHIGIAMGSLSELECLLDIAGDLGYLSHQQLKELRSNVNETFPLVVGLWRKLRNHP